MLVNAETIQRLNDRFAGATPVDVLRFVHATFGPRGAILSSMQRGGCVICHMAERAGLPFDVLFVDTGLLHAETHWTAAELARTHAKLKLVTLAPERSFAQQTAEDGLLYVTRDGQERCCELRKTVPLLQVKGRYDIIVNALRREEGGARSRTKTFALDPRMNTIRVHPLAYASRDDMEAYVRDNPDVALNPLHAMGFPTIGCYTCTTPTLPTEGRRAGRWRHLSSVEYCGINPTDLGASKGAIEIDDRYADLL